MPRPQKFRDMFFPGRQYRVGTRPTRRMREADFPSVIPGFIQMRPSMKKEPRFNRFVMGSFFQMMAT
jgi:hypothetical protein